MNILLVSLARMGDLVQMTPAMIGLHDREEARVHLLVTSNLADFAGQLDGVDEVLVFEDDLLNVLISKGTSLAACGARWRAWIGKLRERHFEVVINLTHDDLSAHLASQLNAPLSLGRQRVHDGSMVIHGPWFRYFFTVFHHREINSFNLCDIYRMGAGVERGEIAVSATPLPLEELLASAIAALPRPLVALHPGANHPARRWSIDSYAELARSLVANGVGVVLIGGTAERGLCDQVAAEAGLNLTNLAGRIELVQLPALLAAVDLLVTNDTGPLHVAASVGTQTVSLFLAMARPEDTAPGAAGHLVIETLHPDHPSQEHPKNPIADQSWTIPATDVLHFVCAELGLQTPFPDQASARCYRVLRTRFDRQGCLDLEELHRFGGEDHNAGSARHWRNVWYSLLAETEESTSEIDLTEPEDSDNFNRSIERALQMSEGMLNRITNPATSTLKSDSLSLAQLESQWLNLEKTAGSISALLLLYRLEREWLYTRGLAALRSQFPILHARYNRLFSCFLHSRRAEEVMP